MLGYKSSTSQEQNEIEFRSIIESTINTNTESAEQFWYINPT